MAGVYRLKIDQGTTVRRGFRWLRNTTPVDLTGCRARMEIRTAVGGALIHRLDTDEGDGLTIDGPAGMITLSIPPSVSSAWTSLTGVYDLEVVFPDGTVTRLVQGPISVSAEVTTGE
ncbi:hypothetical protein [Nonomuraea sp. NPDC049129]|uniref:hypothetical protein n=1 Tax=Nonomuraea sp. NPDC049129 TaxID=3155272 RepID=UPI0033E82555